MQEITKKRQEELAFLKRDIHPKDVITELNLTRSIDREGSNYIRLHVPWRKDEHPSLVAFWGAKTNCWQWKDMAQGWVGSNIDFWQKVQNCDYVTAIRQMRETFLSHSRSYQPHTRPQQQKQGQEKSKVEKAKVVPLKKAKIIKVGPVRHPALIQYMRERGIEKAPDWLKEVHWQERGKKFFALGIQDRNNNWHVRNSLVKRCIKTTPDKETTYTHIKKEKGRLAVLVTEGLFDALTWEEATRRGISWAVDTDLIILNGVGNTEKLFRDGVLKNYRTVYLALDHDQNRARTGQKVSRMLVERLGFGKGNMAVVRLDDIYAGHKDLNEVWQEKYTKSEQRPEKEEKEKRQEQEFEIGV